MRKAFLALGKYSHWPREELRKMLACEFASYFETAEELLEESKAK